VVQEIPVRELIEHILGMAGKDEPRVREILRGGVLVSGASRFRWAAWEPELEGLRELLATFPDPDPFRPFAAERCVRAILRGGRRAIEIPREAAARKSWFQRESFWDLLLAVIGNAGLAYSGYSYHERADRYVREFTRAEAERLRAASSAVRYSTLRDQIRCGEFARAELHVTR
jgi:Lon protease-like protein